MSEWLVSDLSTARLFAANSQFAAAGDRLGAESTGAELMRRTDTSRERCAQASREQAERRMAMHRSGADRQYI